MNILNKISESLFGGKGGADGDSNRRGETRSETPARTAELEDASARSESTADEESASETDEFDARDGDSADSSTDDGEQADADAVIEEAEQGEGASATADDERDDAADASEREDVDDAAGPSSGHSDSDERDHGLHWNTVLHPDDQSDAVPEIVSATVEEGDILEGIGGDDRSETDDEISGYRRGDGPVGTVAVTRDDEVATAYPVVDGIEHEVALESVDEWESGLEAWLEGSLSDVAITSFAANYVERSSASGVDADGEQSVSLALLAYNMGQAEDTITTDSGDEIDVSEFVGIRPWEQGGADDYVIRTEIEAVERVPADDDSDADGDDEADDTDHVSDYEGYILRVPLFRMDDGEEFDVTLFVADHVAGDYDPQVGDTIEGACWLQAWMQE